MYWIFANLKYLRWTIIWGMGMWKLGQQKTENKQLLKTKYPEMCGPPKKKKKI